MGTWASINPKHEADRRVEENPNQCAKDGLSTSQGANKERKGDLRIRPAIRKKSSLLSSYKTQK